MSPGCQALPIIDYGDGRGNTPWGFGSSVSGPESGYAWALNFDKDIQYNIDIKNTLYSPIGDTRCIRIVCADKSAQGSGVVVVPLENIAISDATIC